MMTFNAKLFCPRCGCTFAPGDRGIPSLVDSAALVCEDCGLDEDLERRNDDLTPRREWADVRVRANPDKLEAAAHRAREVLDAHVNSDNAVEMCVFAEVLMDLNAALHERQTLKRPVRLRMLPDVVRLPSAAEVKP